MIIGLDVGSSAVKLVGLSNGQLVAATRIKASDDASSLPDILSQFLDDNHIAIADVEKVGMTGVGTSHFTGDILNLPTFRVDEFIADALGAHYLMPSDRMVVVSMGTGTTFVKYDNGDIAHMGGIGMGGGTLSGLSRLLLDTDDIPYVMSLASKGSVSNVNLLISDVCKEPIPGLPPFATASLLAKLQHNTKTEDVALAIIWLVLETICSGATLVARPTGINDFCLIGSLSSLPQCSDIISIFHDVYGINIRVSKQSPFATAIGAAMYPDSITSSKSEI